MRCLVLAVVIAGCDHDERSPAATLPTYGAAAFIEVFEVTVTDMDAPPDARRIKITGDGTLVDERDHHETQHRRVSSRKFAELVQELKTAGALTLQCTRFDHGRHTTLTLGVPEGRA